MRGFRVATILIILIGCQVSEVMPERKMVIIANKEFKGRIVIYENGKSNRWDTLGLDYFSIIYEFQNDEKEKNIIYENGKKYRFGMYSFTDNDNLPYCYFDVNVTGDTVRLVYDENQSLRSWDK